MPTAKVQSKVPTSFEMPADDDIYVNQGESYDTAYYPTADPARTEAESAEKAIKAASYPILPAIAEWFEETIAACDNIHNIETTAVTINGTSYSRTVSIEGQLLAFQLLKEKLTEKHNEFATWAKEHDA